MQFRVIDARRPRRYVTSAQCTFSTIDGTFFASVAAATGPFAVDTVTAGDVLDKL